MSDSRIAAPTGVLFVALKVLLPFTTGYFLSYLFRSVNAVIAPGLQRDLGIGAGDLGALTAAYFISFAAVQFPLGLLLDRYGPRKVQAAFLIFAVLGAALFAVSNTLAMLIFARTLIGLGVAGSLMSAMKAITLWLPSERWPLANGVFMTAGGLGALAATLPVELLLRVMSWHGIFWLLALLSLLSAATIFFVVPDKPAPQSQPQSLRMQLREYGEYIRDRRFWRLAPLCMIAMATGMSIQGLWSGPYLRDVGGLSRHQAAELQFLLALALTFGFTLSGIVADWLGRLGVSLKTLLCVASSAYALLVLLLAGGWAATHPLIWIAFGLISNSTVLAYPILSKLFPIQAVGRVNTMLNGMVFGFAFFAQAGLGWVIDLWPRGPQGEYPAIAYSWAFGLPALLIVAALIWYASEPKAAQVATANAPSGGTKPQD